MAGQSDWDPALYLGFADARLRPALDLLTQIPLESPRRIVDLGCGPGNATAHLRRRWPAAEIRGIDSSAEMLAAAAEALPDIAWQQADIAAWAPEAASDLIYSNAALHWLPDHAALLPRLMGYLAPGGILALQMPQTGDGAWRRIARDLAAEAPWAERLGGAQGPSSVQTPAAYHRRLQPLAAHLDIWETEYLHILTGPDPVAEWTRGAGLRPLLSVLEEADRKDFFETYRQRLRAAYPLQPDGTTLLPFRRIFAVAQVAATQP